MIAHRIERKRLEHSSAAKLVKYLVSAKGSINPSTWQRTADYLLDSAQDAKSGEKVASYRISHCGTQDPADATLQILATQAANTRSKTDKTYHLVYAFPPGEQPPLPILHAIEDSLCQAIGLGNHQRISAVHVDRDHLHVHVAINKVHPTGLQNIEPYYDKRKLMEACEQLERTYNLQRTHHGIPLALKHQTPVSRPRSNEKIAQMEIHAGLQTLTSRIVQELVPAMRQAPDWQELHRLAASQGVVIRPRGAGLVIGDPKTNLWTKASNLGRDLSMSALTKRLGPFQAPRLSEQAASQGYKPNPIQNSPLSTALFERYQRELHTMLQNRHQAFNQLKQERIARRVHIKRWGQRQRLLLKLVANPKTKRLMYPIIQQQIAAALHRVEARLANQRRTLCQQMPLLTWMEWLATQAEQGNTQALAVLRARAQPTQQGKESTFKFQAAAQAQVKPIVFNQLQPRVRRDGSVAYRTVDGGLVIDRSTEVQTPKATAGAALVALELASQRFAGQNLVVEGTQAFKQEVAQLAALHGISVTFADPDMEQRRQSNLKNCRGESGSSLIAQWIITRNQQQGVKHHRLWQSADAGRAYYQGHQKMHDGTEALLLKRGHELLVKPVTAQERAQTAAWPVGKALVLDQQGRLNVQHRHGVEH